MRRRVAVALAALALLASASCSEDPSALLGRTWVLDPSVVATMQIEVPAGTRVDLVFADDGSIRGIAACNDYGATYEADGADLSFGQISVTAKACEPDSMMELETAYLDLLAQTDSYQVAGDGTSLILSGGPIALGFTEEGSEPSRD